MKIILLLLLVFISDVKPETNFLGTRIINGRPAISGIHRSMVFLSTPAECGGTILSADIVMTAAHCVFGFDRLDMMVLSSSMSPKVNGHLHHVTNVSVHEEYVPYSEDPTAQSPIAVNDIALLKAVPPFSLENGENVPVTLPSPDMKYYEELATAVGWGKTWTGATSLLLQEVNLKIISSKECTEAVGQQIYPDVHLCAASYLEELRMGACVGDSGGPLFVRGMQVGVLSGATVECAVLPNIYTHVPHYVDWIMQQAKVM